MHTFLTSYISIFKEDAINDESIAKNPRLSTIVDNSLRISKSKPGRQLHDIILKVAKISPEIEKISESLTLDKIKELKEIYYISLSNKNDRFIKLPTALQGLVNKIQWCLECVTCNLALLMRKQ